MWRQKFFFTAIAVCYLKALLSQSIDLVHDNIDGAIETVKYTHEVSSNPEEYGSRAVRYLEDFAKYPDKSKLKQDNYTWSQLKEFDGVKDHRLCLAISGYVYDFTDFAIYHPAGPKVLKKYVGRDATAGFKMCGIPPDWVDQVLIKFRVGQVVDYQPDQYEESEK